MSDMSPEMLQALKDRDRSYTMARIFKSGKFSDQWVLTHDTRIARAGDVVTVHAVDNQGFNGQVAWVTVARSGEKRSVSMGALVPAETW